MRAGHGFSIAMELLANDSPDPLGSAFRRVANDMQLGSALDVALGKLSALVPLLDVRFFVSSVLLQQETGGNLSEVLAKLALIIRERFRLKGQVQSRERTWPNYRTGAGSDACRRGHHHDDHFSAVFDRSRRGQSGSHDDLRCDLAVKS